MDSGIRFMGGEWKKVYGWIVEEGIWMDSGIRYMGGEWKKVC